MDKDFEEWLAELEILSRPAFTMNIRLDAFQNIGCGDDYTLEIKNTHPLKAAQDISMEIHTKNNKSLLTGMQSIIMPNNSLIFSCNTLFPTDKEYTATIFYRSEIGQKYKLTFKVLCTIKPDEYGHIYDKKWDIYDELLHRYSKKDDAWLQITQNKLTQPKTIDISSEYGQFNVIGSRTKSSRRKDSD